MGNLKKYLFRSPGHYVVALIITVAMGIFRFCTLPEGIGIGFTVYEVLSVSGYVTFLVGALLTVAYFGAFDLFGYVFSRNRTGEVQKYKNYADYCHKQAEKRARGGYYFLPYYVVGIAVVLLSLLFG